MKILPFILILVTQSLVAQRAISILNFQADNGFRHDSKAEAHGIVEQPGQTNRWKIVTSSDEKTYQGNQEMDGNYSFTWYQHYTGGRTFFTSASHAISIPVSTGLLLDLDANHGVEIENDNRIISWHNQVSNDAVKKFDKQDKGRELAGSGRPTLLKNSSNAGGNNTVVFRRQELVNDNEHIFDHLTTGNGYTWFSVMAVYDQTSELKDVHSFFGNLRNSNIDNKGNYEGFWGGLSDDNKVWMGTRNAITFGRWDKNNPLVINSDPLRKGQYYIVMGRMGAGIENVKLELFINSTSPIAEAFIPVNIKADPSKMTIGQERDATNHPGKESFDGEISRFLIFERPLTDHEMTQILGYLKKKYVIN